MNLGYYCARPNMTDEITRIMKIKLGKYSALKAIKKCEAAGRPCKVVGDILYIAYQKGRS